MGTLGYLGFTMGTGKPAVLALRVWRVRVWVPILVPAATPCPSAQVSVIPYGYCLGQNGRFDESSALVTCDRSVIFNAAADSQTQPNDCLWLLRPVTR
jgi:hypothetical protein